MSAHVGECYLGPAEKVGFGEYMQKYDMACVKILHRCEE